MRRNSQRVTDTIPWGCSASSDNGSTLMLRKISLVSEGDSVSAFRSTCPPRRPARRAVRWDHVWTEGLCTNAPPSTSHWCTTGSIHLPSLCQSTSLLNQPTHRKQGEKGRSKRLEDRDMELKARGRRDKSKNNGKFVEKTDLDYNKWKELTGETNIIKIPVTERCIHTSLDGLISLQCHDVSGR